MVAEVLEEALELGMLAGDAGALPPPDALAVAAMSVSTFSRSRRTSLPPALDASKEQLLLAICSSFLPWMTTKTSACCAAARGPSLCFQVC